MKPLFNLAKTGEKKTTNKDSVQFYKVVDNILYRYVVSPKETLQQIVVPKTLTKAVLFAAHDTLMSGHYSFTKTYHRAQGKFYWPGMRIDINTYCKSCDAC